MRMAQCNVVWAYKQVLSNTRHPRSTSQLSAKQCLLRRYLSGEGPLRIPQHSPGMLSIDALAHENCSLRVKNFC